MSGKGQTGHPGNQSPDFLTMSDHSYPRSGPLPVVTPNEGAAEAEVFIPSPRHEHSMAGFQSAASAALADKSITDELRAQIIEGARTRYGWTRAEVREWMDRHTS